MSQPEATTAPAQGEFARGWKVLAAAATGAGAGINGVHFYAISLFLIPLAQSHDWSRTQVSAMKTFMTLGLITTAPLVGILADKLGVRKIGIISMATLALASAAMTQITSSIVVFYVALFLLAGCGGGTTALVWTRGVASWFVKQRGIALAITATGTGVAGVITPPLIGGLIDKYGWQAGYLGIAALAALAIIPVYFLFIENDAPVPGTATTAAPIQTGLEIGEAVRTRRFWQNGVAFLIIGAIVSSLTVHLVPLLGDMGLSREAALGVAGALGGAVIVGRLFTGVLVDKFHPAYVAGLFLFLPVVSMGIFLAAPHVTPLVILGVVMVGFAAGSEVHLLPYLTARYFGLKHYGKIYSWQYVMFYSGVGVGPVSFGYVFDQAGSYSPALVWSMPILAFGALMITFLGKGSPMDAKAA